MAGYSSTPLPKKLGIKKGHRVLVQRGGDFTLAGVPKGVRVLKRRTKGSRYDVILAFCRDLHALDEILVPSLDVMPADGSLWLCWPKKSSSVETDISEANVRAAGLEAGVVDVKICAVDDTWSGLKFMVRTKDRGRWAIRDSPDP